MSCRHYVLDLHGRLVGARDGGPWSHAVLYQLPGRKPGAWGHALCATPRQVAELERRARAWAGKQPTGTRVAVVPLKRRPQR